MARVSVVCVAKGAEGGPGLLGQGAAAQGGIGGARLAPLCTFKGGKRTAIDLDSGLPRVPAQDLYLPLGVRPGEKEMSQGAVGIHTPILAVPATDLQSSGDSGSEIFGKSLQGCEEDWEGGQ